MQASRPALAELGLFLVTWPGPWLFLLLCYVSTSMMRSPHHNYSASAYCDLLPPAARFSAYLATRLDRPVGWSLGRGRAILARFWAGYTGWWHGQTVTGLDNIPRNTAAILVWYHGPLPVDYM